MGSSGSGPETRWVVVDTDAGLDDAHALLYLLAQPDVRILGVTSVFGNTPVENAARNAATVLRVAGRGDVPVYLGAAVPLAGQATFDTFWHGEDGLGDRGLVGPPPRLQNESAADFLVRVANEHPGRVDLHPIGPLTNVALALESDPELLCKFRTVVIMGGGGPYPAPGELPCTDANSDHDRAAAELVYTSKNTGNVIMVGVNVSLKALLDERAYQRLSEAPGSWARFAAQVLDASNDVYQYMWGRRVSAAHDGLASVILHRPDLVTRWVRGPVTFTPTAGSFAVQVARTHAGAQLSFRTAGGPMIRAVAGFDRAQFEKVFLAALITGRRKCD